MVIPWRVGCSRLRLAIWLQPEKALETTDRDESLDSKNEKVNVNGYGTIPTHLDFMGAQCSYSRLEIGIREPCE